VDLGCLPGFLPGFFYSQPSMALTLSGHRRFAPMFKIAPGDFVTFVLVSILVHIVNYDPCVSIACRLAATAITLAKYAELYEKLSVCLQQS